MEHAGAISKLHGWNCTTFLAFVVTIILDRVSVVFIFLQRHLEELASHRLLNNLQQLVSGWDDNFPTLCRCICFNLWQILCNIVSVMLGINCWCYAILLLLCNIAGVVQYCWCCTILLVLYNIAGVMQYCWCYAWSKIWLHLSVLYIDNSFVKIGTFCAIFLTNS